jgi:hypothetical protein
MIEQSSTITVKLALQGDIDNGRNRLGLIARGVNTSLDHALDAHLLDSSSTLHYLSKNKREDST